MNKRKTSAGKSSQSSNPKRQTVREKRRQQQRRQRITFILVVVGAALVIAGLLAAPSIRNAMTPVGEIVQITPNSPPNANANSMGDPNAPVKIEEYSDFQCPYCKQFNDDTEQQMINSFVATGQVYFVYNSMGNWVSDNIGRGGTESQDAAEAAYCAGDQNKFWEYHDMLFANWKGEGVGSFTPKRLMAFAEALNLNMNEFNSCYNSNKYRSKVQQDKVNGIKAGINGTPAFIINGKLVEGYQSFSQLQTEIQNALGGSG
jgi:protein-disulfide isomerase